MSCKRIRNARLGADHAACLEPIGIAIRVANIAVMGAAWRSVAGPPDFEAHRLSSHGAVTWNQLAQQQNSWPQTNVHTRLQHCMYAAEGYSSSAASTKPKVSGHLMLAPLLSVNATTHLQLVRAAQAFCRRAMACLMYPTPPTPPFNAPVALSASINLNLGSATTC